MSGPPFTLLYVPEARAVIEDMKRGRRHAEKLKKVRTALRLLGTEGPRYPGLHSHQYESIPGPGGVALWESYVENRTPSAWRVWWIYRPGPDEITVVTLGPHP